MANTPVVLTLNSVTAGQATRLTTSSIYCTSFYIEARAANTGIVYLGVGSSTSSTNYITAMAASGNWNQKVDNIGMGVKPVSGEFKLDDYYINSSTTNGIVQITYWPRIGTTA